MSLSTFSRTVPTAIFARSSSYRGIHMVLNILDSYPYKLAAVNLLSLLMSNSTLLYKICPRSASHLLDSRNDLSTVLDFARPTHPLSPRTINSPQILDHL